MARPVVQALPQPVGRGSERVLPDARDDDPDGDPLHMIIQRDHRSVISAISSRSNAITASRQLAPLSDSVP